MSNAIAAKLNSKDQFSFNEMLAVLKIQKDEKGGIGAQNQTQFDYVKQRIFEETGQTWRWEGAPKDGYWVRVNDAITTAKTSLDSNAIAKPICPQCSKPNPYKNGFDSRSKKPKFKCKSCGKQWVSE